MFSLVTPPTNGEVTLNPDGTFTYTPDPIDTGTGVFLYEVCDPAGNCDTGTVVVTVEPSA